MKRHILYLLLALLAIGSLSAQDYLAFDFTGEVNAAVPYTMLEGQDDLNSIYDRLRGNLDYRSPYFDLLIDWGWENDGRYIPEEKYLGGRYFAMHDTRVRFHRPDGLFSVSAGRGPNRDAVQSPYSVFANSNDIPAMQLDFTFDSGRFFYTTRWIELCRNSRFSYIQDSDDYSNDNIFVSDMFGTEWSEGYNGGWLDKGANFKTFGVRMGPWRFGFQDVVIYIGRNFDPEYFLNPMPQYFVQLINSAAGRPWSQADNAKSFMGFFADYSGRDSYGAAQLLIDDLNASALPGVNTSDAIKTKIAWSVGGWKDFDFGRMGFYHGGATKYTFEATYTAHHFENYKDNPGFIAVPYSIFPYEATYYPATEYASGEGGTMPIDYTENYFGYKYGENNLAFLVDYQNRFFAGSAAEFGFYGSAEYVLNGAKSPANPWHEYYTGGDIDGGVALLDGTVEHLLRLSAALRKPLGRDFVLNLDLIGGVAINAMKLIQIDPVYSEELDVTTSWKEPKIYVPESGCIEPIFQATIGGTWHIQVLE